MAEAAERQLARPLERRRPPRYWLMAPGWRVVLETGSLEGPALEAIEWLRRREVQDAAAFYQALSGP